ncbi:MAG: glutathione S-transferase [Pseudomonadota bacterium]
MTTPNLTIYEHKGFPNPERIRIAFAEKGLLDSVQFRQVDVLKGEHRTDEFLGKNPSGLVPILELEDGTVISECSAIIDYVDHLTGERELTGKTPQERGVIGMMQRRVESGLLEAVGTYFHVATDGLGPDLERVHNKEWGNMQRERALATMHYLDDVLKSQAYIAGDRFTDADITAIAGLKFAAFAKIDIPANLTALKEWYDRVQKRPSLNN